MGIFGAAGSGGLLAGNIRNRNSNVAQIKLHSSGILQMSWHTLSGGLRDKFIPIEYLKIAKQTDQNKDSEYLHFKVPYDRGSYSIDRKGVFIEAQKCKEIFGPHCSSLDA
mmetsp:Transcript_23431/g.43819  ORF Transcript_23431/g.43819 Transcript_23431/m.43819 type:complete len:110 (+) Transcript_23431:640-969(+)